MTDTIVNNVIPSVIDGGPRGPVSLDGLNGWTPILAVITDTTRRVLQVYDWTGGTGTKPATGQYVSATGLTPTLASAIDIRGATGSAGAGATFPATYTALKALTPTGSDPVFVKGAVAEADGGQGWFWYDSTDSTSADNGGTVLVGSGNRWKRLFTGAYEAGWFGGLKADAVTNDSATIQAAIDYATSIGGAEVHITAPDHSSYIIRCNLTLKTGVTLSGDSGNFGVGISSPAAPKVQLYAFASLPVIDTPVATIYGAAVTGLSIVGFGSTGTGTDQGIRLRAGWWCAFRKISVRNCGDQGILANLDVGGVYEDLLMAGCLLNRVRAADSGVLEIHGTDTFFSRMECNSSQSVLSSGGTFRLCAILNDSTGSAMSQCIGELSDRGIVVKGSFVRISGCRGDNNFAVGWDFVGSNGSSVSSCLALNNGQAATNTYAQFHVDGTSAGNVFSACEAIWDGTGNAPKYGFDDAANGMAFGVRNHYDATCRSNGHATAAFNNTTGGSAFMVPEGPCINFADGDTSPSVQDWGCFASVNSGPTTITTFDNSHNGHKFMLYVADANTTLQWGSPIRTLSGVDELIPIGTLLEIYNQAGVFFVMGQKSLKAGAGTATQAPIVLQAGVNLTTPAAGAHEYDGKAFYKTPNANNRAVDLAEHFLCLSADQTGGNVNTAQTWFPGGGSTTITLPAATAYEFEGELYLSRAAGTTSHTIAVLFGGTATLTGINYDVEATSTTGNVLGAPSFIRGDAAAAVVVTAASIVATENNIIKVKGIVRINVAGTLIPQFQFSAAPGGAPTVKANSIFRLRPIGANTVLKQGNWT